MDRDGTQDGYDTDLLRAISSQVEVPVIASGGAGEPSHLVDGFEAGADAVLLASDPALRALLGRRAQAAPGRRRRAGAGAQRGLSRDSDA